LAGWISARTVIETKTYEAQRDAIVPNVRRFDEVMRGVYWALSTRPEAFPPVDPSNPTIHVLKTDAFSDIPRLRIFYKFDDVAVQLLWVEVI